jgi:hypothetical protein
MKLKNKSINKKDKKKKTISKLGKPTKLYLDHAKEIIQ